VLGVVFVVTSLIAAAFAVKRRRRRDADKEDLPCKKEAKGSRGLCFTLENPSSTFHQNPWSALRHCYMCVCVSNT
jgi:hypothetical protein